MLDEIYNQYWSISETHYLAVVAGLEKFLNAEIPKPMLAEYDAEPDDYALNSGVATIPIAGIIVPAPSMMTRVMRMFGAPVAIVSEIITMLDRAEYDPDVESLYMPVDSPGGILTGVDDLATRIRGFSKPVKAATGSVMASGGYYAVSGADEIQASESAIIGSIGVIYEHREFSKMDEALGVTRTIFTGGKEKAYGNDAEPLSDEARDSIQAKIDYYENMFIDAVALGRGVAPETVRANMAEGRQFIGRQALDAGLIDAIQGDEPIQQGDDEMEIKTTDDLRAAHPDLVADIEASVKPKVTEKDIEAAVADEQTRILALAGVQFGEEAGEKFTALVNSGATPEQVAAIAASMGSGETEEEPDPAKANLDKAKTDMLAAIKAAGAENPGAGGGANAGDQDFMAMVKAYAKENDCKISEAMQAVMRENPAAHKTYLEAQNPGESVH